MLVARATWCPGFVHLCTQQQLTGLCNGDGSVVNEVGAEFLYFTGNVCDVINRLDIMSDKINWRVLIYVTAALTFCVCGV